MLVRVEIIVINNNIIITMGLESVGKVILYRS
jgi:hypothetical protein